MPSRLTRLGLYDAARALNAPSYKYRCKLVPGQAQEKEWTVRVHNTSLQASYYLLVLAKLLLYLPLLIGMFKLRFPRYTYAPTTEVPSYFPKFIWRLWTSDSIGQPFGLHIFHNPRIHLYDVYSNELSELHETPEQKVTAFQDFLNDSSSGYEHDYRVLLRAVEEALSVLERETELALVDILHSISLGNDSPKKRIPLELRAVNTIRKFFVFLHYRNSGRYAATISQLKGNGGDKAFLERYSPLLDHVRERIILQSFLAFLTDTPFDKRQVIRKTSSDRAEPYSSSYFNRTEDQSHRKRVAGSMFQDVHECCWRLNDAEICVGLASEDQEFLLPESCWGTLDAGFSEDPKSSHLFFPINPTVAIYVLANDTDNPLPQPPRSPHSTIWIDCGIESASDVHLRNAMILQAYPQFLYFSGLRSVAQSVMSYDEFRWIPEHQDYSRMKQRCRQKFTQESVTKSLVVKGSVMVTDLTDEVIRVGNSAVAHGSFSDVWKGIWTNHEDKTSRLVALKFLRPVMVQNIRDKLLKRLKDEVVAWHRLKHPNIANLSGVIQSLNTIAMVSEPWCEHGNISHYLKKVNPAADRVAMLIQVASAVQYLHSCQPAVVHGDLKGGNILIDDYGSAIITDFGLSKVVEDISETMSLASSFFAGSTRWMAPELILSLVEDDGRRPPITTFSDVYAFASVCLEVVTGEVPFPHRSNDHAVMFDIMRGVKPSRGTSCYVHGKDMESFWDMMDHCWDSAYGMRPPMTEVSAFLVEMAKHTS